MRSDDKMVTTFGLLKVLHQIRLARFLMNEGKWPHLNLFSMPQNRLKPANERVRYEKMKIEYKDSELEIEYFVRIGTDTTMFFLHGGACSKDDFFAATERDELRNHTLIAFDFPGCGNSPYPANGHLDVDDLAKITHIVIERLKLKNPILIGHSTGGMVAMLYLAKYDNVSAFINVEGNLAPENVVFSRQVVQSPSFDEFKNKTYIKLMKDLAASGNTGFQKWSESLQKASPQAFYDICPSLVGYSDSGIILKQYLELDIPKVYIHGSENTKRLSFLARIQAQNGLTSEISGSNHFPFHDNPDEFYRVVTDFLDRIKV